MPVLFTRGSRNIFASNRNGTLPSQLNPCSASTKGGYKIIAIFLSNPALPQARYCVIQTDFWSNIARLMMFRVEPWHRRELVRFTYRAEAFPMRMTFKTLWFKQLLIILLISTLRSRRTRFRLISGSGNYLVREELYSCFFTDSTQICARHFEEFLEIIVVSSPAVPLFLKSTLFHC